MSFVDKYHTRHFVNGQLLGGTYDEMTGRYTYTDISPWKADRIDTSNPGLDFGGNRMAGSGLGLGNDVVAYMGNAGMGGERDEGMDDFIGRAVTGVINNLLLRPGDKAESRTMEYRPERDALSGELVAGGFRGKDYGQINPRRGGLEYMTKQALESLPNSDLAGEKHRQIRSGTALPGFLKGV